MTSNICVTKTFRFILLKVLLIISLSFFEIFTIFYHHSNSCWLPGMRSVVPLIDVTVYYCNYFITLCTLKTKMIPKICNFRLPFGQSLKMCPFDTLQACLLWIIVTLLIRERGISFRQTVFAILLISETIEAREMFIIAVFFQ